MKDEKTDQLERFFLSLFTRFCVCFLLCRYLQGNRVVSLDDLASRGKLGSREAAEDLVMKAMAQGMIKGSIDQVAGTVQVTWVQPRVLTHDQVRDLQTRLNNWASKVNNFATAI